MKKNSEIAERQARAERLKQARINSNEGGVRAVSKKFGWNLNNYKAHDSGQNGFGIADAREYAKAYRVSLQWLYFGTGSPNQADPKGNNSAVIDPGYHHLDASPENTSTEHTKSTTQIGGWRPRLQEAIIRSGKSAREVSLAAGKGPGYVHSILKEGKDPTIDNLLTMCAVLNISISHLIHGIELSRETEEILALLEGSPNSREGILKILKDKASS